MLIKRFAAGLNAGVCISLGCSVFLACENRYIGAVLFSVALLSICLFGFSLYTGKIGFMALSHKKDDFSVLLLGLLGNVVATALLGFLLAAGVPALKEAAIVICEKKLTQEWYQTLIRGFFCGILMYIAVWVYKEKKNTIGILFAIPVFILSGFEHSIANMCYFAVSGIVSVEAFLYIMLVVVGNTFGSLLIPFLGKLGVKGEADAKG